MLASQLDPEEWRPVVRAYQETYAKVVRSLPEGHSRSIWAMAYWSTSGTPFARGRCPRAVEPSWGMVEGHGTTQRPPVAGA